MYSIIIPKPCIQMAHGWKVTFKIKIIGLGEWDCGYTSAPTFSLPFSKFQKGYKCFQERKRNGTKSALPRMLLDLDGESLSPPSLQINQKLRKEGTLSNAKALYPVKVNGARLVRRVNKISYGLQVIHSQRSVSVRLLSLVEEQQNSIKE